ncbi:MAG: hypothetical protein JM58_09385 [Peptococcaceae bacterium BICA1-8]|nr:MAG: hypothetical protein JM58_09385 [Peptococcaceae bacterium BICA1-8]
MREIKFRLWCKEKKEWEQNLWTLTPDGRIFDMQRNCLYKNNGNHILMQFTGLYDKSGKEIYEGDIGKTDFANMIVSYQKDWGTYILSETLYDVFEFWVINAYKGELEVIGNIYENPELIL